MNEDTIQVRIAASIAGLEAGMQEAVASVQSSTVRMSESLGGLGTAIERVKVPFTAMIALMAGGALFREVVGETGELGESLTVLSEKTGIAVDRLSALQFAAKMVNVSSGALDVGFKKLATSMQEALILPTSNAALAFRAMGLDVKNFHGDLSVALDAIADKFASYEDGANKSALATDLFGRSGTDLIPLLDQGSAGIGRLKDEAASLGAVMTDQQARVAVQYEEQMKRVKASIDGLERGIAVALMPTLQSLGELFEQNVVKSGLLDAAITTLRATVAFITNGILGLKVALAGFATTVDLLWTLITKGPKAAKEELKIMADKMAEIEDHAQKMEDINWVAAFGGNVSGGTATSTQPKGATGSAPTASNTQKPDTTKADAFKEANRLLHELDAFEQKNSNEQEARLKKTIKSIDKEFGDEEKRRQKAIDDYQHKWESAFSIISSTVATAFDGVIRGTQTVSQAFDNLARNILLRMVQGIEKAFEVWLATELTKRAMSAATAKKSIINDAHEAFSKAYKATAGIPYVGPFLAPAAGAAAFAAVAAMSAGVSAAGGFDIPSGVNPVTQLHAREMVLPAALADGLRGLIASGSGGGGGVTVYAMDAKSFRDYLHTNRDSLVPALRTLARNGAL